MIFLEDYFVLVYLWNEQLFFRGLPEIRNTMLIVEIRSYSRATKEDAVKEDGYLEEKVSEIAPDTAVFLEREQTRQSS